MTDESRPVEEWRLTVCAARDHKVDEAFAPDVLEWCERNGIDPDETHSTDLCGVRPLNGDGWLVEVTEYYRDADGVKQISTWADGYLTTKRVVLVDSPPPRAQVIWPV